MKVIERKFLNSLDICVFGITLLSGIRPAGRTVDTRKIGRSKSGILYIKHGAVCFSQESGNVTAVAGDLVMLPQGHEYTMRYVIENTEFILLNYYAMLPNGEPIVFTDRIKLLSGTKNNIRTLNLLEKISASCLNEDNIAIFRRKELVYRLLSLVLEEDIPFEATNSKYANIAPGVLLMQRTYIANVPMSEYAAACNISVSSFRALFTEYYGISPIQYRNSLRLKRAQELLADEGCSVSETAAECGFENTAYFCRFYKKMTGETPKETRLKSK